MTIESRFVRKPQAKLPLNAQSSVEAREPKKLERLTRATKEKKALENWTERECF